MSADERAELRRLAGAATPGGWHVEVQVGSPIVGGRMPDTMLVVGPDAWDIVVSHGMPSELGGAAQVQANVEYIAAVNPATVLGLLDEIDELRSRVTQ